MPRTNCRLCGSPEIPAYMLKKSDYRCASCANEQARAWRQRRAEAGIKSPRPNSQKWDAARYQRFTADPVRRARMMARVIARTAIRRGKLVRQPCEVCGSQPVDAHHDDYSQPLNVRWLCPAHHRAHHASERAAKRA